MEMSTILSLAQLALGAVSIKQNADLARQASTEANRITGIQEGVAQEALGIEREKLADTRQTNELIRQLASTTLEGMNAYDTETFRRSQGILIEALKGTNPIDMMPFRDQFDQIDQASEWEKRRLQESNRKQTEDIARKIPVGGARVRILADIARTMRDSEAQIDAKAASSKKTLNQSISKELFNTAMAFGNAVPEKRMDVLKTVSNMYTGQPQVSSSGMTGIAGTYDAELQRAIAAGKGAQEGTVAMGTLLGTMSARYAEDEKAAAEKARWDDYLKTLKTPSADLTPEVKPTQMTEL